MVGTADGEMVFVRKPVSWERERRHENISHWAPSQLLTTAVTTSPRHKGPIQTLHYSTFAPYMSIVVQYF